jgi:hypothetical protein
MKLKLFLLLLICSFFYFAHCTKQLFSLIEKSSQDHEGSIFGSYIQKVEKKIHKGHKVNDSPAKSDKTQNSVKKGKKSYKKLRNKQTNQGRKLFSHIKKRENMQKFNQSHQHKETQVKKSKVHSNKKLKNNKDKSNKKVNKSDELHKEISFLQSKMKKYMRTNKKLIKEIKYQKHETHAHHHHSHSHHHHYHSDEDDD